MAQLAESDLVFEAAPGFSAEPRQVERTDVPDLKRQQAPSLHLLRLCTCQHTESADRFSTDISGMLSEHTQTRLQDHSFNLTDEATIAHCSGQTQRSQPRSVRLLDGAVPS